VIALRGLVRAASLAALGVAGFLLGSCGGGESALPTATGFTATRPEVTASRPAAPTRTTRTVTSPTRTNETVTEPAVTVTGPATTEEAETVTTVETETAVETETTVIPPPTATAPPPTTTEASTSDTPWGWIALALVAAAVAVLGLVLWRRQRTKAARWSGGLTDLSRRSLRALDDVVAEGSVVTGQVQALADEARSLESSAPDGPSRAEAARLRLRLDDLATALEADRKLRLGSTPPTEQQLAYSTSLVHHEIEQLQDVLRPPDAGQPPQ
jgi:hypothetical protein